MFTKLLKSSFTFFIITLFFLSCGGGGASPFSFSWATSSIFREGYIKTELYELETQGNNGRAYIFTHPKNPNVECIQVALTNGGGLSCYKK